MKWRGVDTHIETGTRLLIAAWAAAAVNRLVELPLWIYVSV